MNQHEFLRRRQALLAKMAPASAALIFAAPEVTRSADSEYPYRQNSDFWYFTGFNEPEAVLVLIKSDETHNHSVLFNRLRDKTAEIWFGRRLARKRHPKNWASTVRWHFPKLMSSCISCSMVSMLSITRRANRLTLTPSFLPPLINCAVAHARILPPPRH